MSGKKDSTYKVILTDLETRVLSMGEILPVTTYYNPTTKETVLYQILVVILLKDQNVGLFRGMLYHDLLEPGWVNLLFPVYQYLDNVDPSLVGLFGAMYM